MIKIGLTGGIGCGKSVVLALFEQYGVSIIDADKEAKQLMAKGGAMLQIVIDHFGKQYLLDSGELDRKKLRHFVFSNKQSLQQLEAITHPIIRRHLLALMDDVDKSSPYLMVDIPLLFEKGYQSLFDITIVVDCTLDQQYARVIKRDEVNYEHIQAVMNQQLSRDERLERADFIIDNSQDMQHLEREVEYFHQQFLSMG